MGMGLQMMQGCLYFLNILFQGDVKMSFCNGLTACTDFYNRYYIFAISLN